MSSLPNDVVAGEESNDNHETVFIDRSIPAEKWRYTCPEGHSDWYPTNNHCWCKGCRRAIEAGHDGLNAEYHQIRDQQTDELIPWDAVHLIDPDEKRLNGA